MVTPFPGEYNPPRLQKAMMVTRLANAEYAAESLQGMRYVIICNVHEGIDPDREIWTLDSLVGCYLSEAEMLSVLSDDSRKRVNWQFN